MDDYIPRSIAIAKLTRLEVTEPLATLADAKRLIADMPAADVPPVARGRWGMGRYNLERNTYEKKCVRCRKWSREYRSPYCPNCGAKMDRE